MPESLSPEQPWPGLGTYDESSRDYFQGRDAETEALTRQICMAPLTVLYGRSGLGKSSLLMAGVFPALRARGYLPVYLRLDFSEQARIDPVDQISRRLAEEIARAGLEGPEQQPGETLWHWLHRKDFELWSVDNRLWTPVLVFDQFEELFSRSGGNLRLISEVFDTLADLAENRIEHDVADSRSGRDTLDLIRQRYRMVLSFREDFLPDVRAWERQVPSLLRNDLRLVPMTREQAVGAVRRAGASVLAPGAAERLVDFVGALAAAQRGSEGASTTLSGKRDELTIEPALLSLCGAQLARRVAPGEKIDRKLLDKVGLNILEGFYRDALADMPDSVHCFIEDYLLQGDRTRGSYARDEALEQGFISSEQLAILTDQRRLLRVAQEGGVPRIELIHDRLVDVVRRSRDRRAALHQAQAVREQERQKERQEAADRLAAEQAARLQVETAARAKAERDAAQIARNSRWLRTWLGLAVALALVSMTIAYLAHTYSREAAENILGSRGFAATARDLALSNNDLRALVRVWVEAAPAGARTEGLEQALQAYTALRRLRPPVRALDAAAPPAPDVRIVSHQHFAGGEAQGAFVRQALSDLDYVLSEQTPVPGPASVLLAGSDVAVDDIRKVALALIQASVPVQAVLRFGGSRPNPYPLRYNLGPQAISIVAAPAPAAGDPRAITVEQLMADDFSR